MNWNRIKCAVLGHKWQVEAGRIPCDVGAPADCVRCAEHYPGIRWDSVPAMPECKPSRVEPCECGMPTQCTIWSPTGPRAGHHKPPPPEPPARKETISVKVELDGLEEAKAEVEKLHARWTEVLAMRDAAARWCRPCCPERYWVGARSRDERNSVFAAERRRFAHCGRDEPERRA